MRNIGAAPAGALEGQGMATENEAVRLSLTVSPELNRRLEQLAASGQTTKSEILRKAIALFDVVQQAQSDHKRIGILDQDSRLLTEIVGI